ncbi:MAG: RNA pseudouridylate synthase family protein [Candidatus Xenolissoclinum pacificiensis L6]|uniref:Ribosomal large subunit pseudouridine synthase C n=1 Tax=Candidatus Xenolissoclinum pacificiensis L6 TaxID=1401685 RepID=W2UYW2_9RICK|nr:MAG: RNA pseudouridylate synthase family protein [Candidatus Xenolissoclinum pacificiensis L6]
MVFSKAIRVTISVQHPTKVGCFIRDYFSQKHSLSLSRGFIEKSLRLKKILVDSKRVSYGTSISQQSIVEADSYWYNNASSFKKSYLKNSLLLENQYIMAFNKPPNLPVQGGYKITSCMIDILKEHYPKHNLHTVHRLDKETSGIIIFAKNKKYAKFIAEQFKNRKVYKVYHALVHPIPSPIQNTINLPLQMKKIGGQYMMIQANNSNGKDAVTQYEVISSNPKNNTALVKCIIYTGRTHQIRAHLHSLNYGILGDRLYKKHSDTIKSRNLCLHSSHITCLMPDGQHISISSQIPKYMRLKTRI